MCRYFSRSRSCKFGTFCAYDHGVDERDGFGEGLARDRRVLQERIERVELQIKVLETKENELLNRIQDAVTTAMGKLVKGLVHHLYPILGDHQVVRLIALTSSYHFSLLV